MYRSGFCFDAVAGRWWPGWSGCSSSTGTTGGSSGSSARTLADQALKAKRLHQSCTARLPHSGVTPYCFYAVVERWLGGWSSCSHELVLPPGCPVVPPGRVLLVNCEARLYQGKDRLYRCSTDFAVTVGLRVCYIRVFLPPTTHL